MSITDHYKAAWQEWKASGESELWEMVVGDGLEQQTTLHLPSYSAIEDAQDIEKHDL
ncbi:hypothetical protein Dxin01_01875 [Deinococcus xinjiangensis]|uniref:Uncharacterized protein n=1 Tax=Deinococcus xinjiangensis TaxID=457454 RepID=A0ABP9VBM3_9DEIO